MSNDRRKLASYLLPDPGGEVVRGMLDEIDALRARVAELEELVQRTLWHAENLHLILPREMVAEFRAALEGKAE